MHRWFKDFCVIMEFVINDHPWCIDWHARNRIKMIREQKNNQIINDKIEQRIKEIECDQ